MLQDMFHGILAFFEATLLIFLVTELNLLVEEWFAYKFELRKGFQKKFFGHLRFFIRGERSISQILTMAGAFFPLIWVTSLLPGLSGKIFFPLDQSILVFTFVMTALPVAYFFLRRDAVPGFVERVKERSMGAFMLLLLFALNLFLITGETDISKIQELQQKGAWLIFQRPITLLIFCGILITTYYVTQQKVFSSTQNLKLGQEQILLLNVWKSSWLIFLVTTFLGGGGVAVILKVFLLNLVATLGLSTFSKLREEQTEELILWEAAPLVLFLLLLTLVYVGAKR